tara:strand:- start:229 stop:402 length:174 start_codon:yes stop_codon:yes gene_type:complete
MAMTVDITPTWEALLPVLIRVATQGETAEAQEGAMSELLRMARACDEMNAKAKEDNS